MSISFSNLSRKQLLITVIGILVVIVLLIILGNMYGRFLTTSITGPAPATYSGTGAIKSEVFQDPGTYTLTFNGQTQNAQSMTNASTTFQIVSGGVSSEAPTTATPIPSTSALPY